MADDPLRTTAKSEKSVGIPYILRAFSTSIPESFARVYQLSLWIVLLAFGLIYVPRYSLTNPYVDEWAFVPVLLEEEPYGPWLWELHNEHRFPLPRALYIGLFRLTGDLRLGCLVSLLGISGLALSLMFVARRVRGRAAVADSLFPLMLMHVGQGENLYMGYQMCFMLTTVLAGVLLAVMVLPALTRRHFCQALAATGLGWALLTCGAGGLAYGVAAAAWVALLAVRGGMRPWQRALLGVLLFVTPIYIACYFNGYVRPEHHPPSAGVIPSLRVALQAQSMAFGPAATGLWPAFGVTIFIAAVAVVAQLTARSFRDLRYSGLLLFVLAGGAVAFGIGWGRSGFVNDMGFAWRYCWLMFPPVAAAYFVWLLRGGTTAVYLPNLLFIVAAILCPINVVSGFVDTERRTLALQRAWEADVRAGKSAEAIAARHYPEYSESSRREIARMMRLMRDKRYTYYESLGRENP